MNTEKHTLTIGIDLGDKAHGTCSIDANGEVVARSTLINDKDELIRFSENNKGAQP